MATSKQYIKNVTTLFFLFCGLIFVADLLAASSDNPVPLPAPSGTIINVSTVEELQEAVNNIQSNTAIVIAPGNYRLTNTLFFNGGGGVTNVSIRGETTNRGDVIIEGLGMSNANYGNVPHGIMVENIDGITIANLTIKDIYFHPITFNIGTQAPHIFNVRLLDAGEQFVKANPDGSGGGVNDGIVEYSVFEYSTTAKSYYTNAVDVHTGRNWAIRHNLFKNIRAPQGELAGPAVLMWNNTQNSIVEGNTFIECQRGISLGLIDRTPNDHVGGIIRNNFFYRSSSLSGDAPIFVGDSPGTKVLHNTIIASGTYPSAIEYRFADATNVLIANNLSDAAIQPRDGASGVERNNMTSATASLFVNAAGGDLHLTSGASAVIDQAEMEADASDDWDSTARPQGNAVDIGADEYESEAPVTPLPATPPPFTDEQINPDTDLEYLGAFKMPMGAIGSSSWSYGGNGMTYYPGGDPLGDTDGFPGSLYGVGHVYQAQVSEINIPAPVISPSKNLNDLPRAQTLQPFVDITGGMQSPSLTSLAVGDIQYLPKQGQQGTDKLYWVMYEYYMPDVDDEFGFGWSELDLSNIDPKGSWRLNGVVSAAGQKYLFEIPQAVADTYFGGKNLAAGRSRIVNGGSWGPALFAFAPWAEGNPPPSGATLDAVTLLSYSAGWGSPDDPNYRKLTNYGHADDWVDGAWLTLEGKSAVIFVGTKPAMTMGNGEYYGAPRPEGCGDKGWHGEPYSSAILFYDTSELIAVSQEAMQPYEPQPYAIIDVENLMFNNSCNAEQLGGVGYDRTNNLLYVMEKKVQEDYEQAQVIHVWHLIDQNPVPVINSISIQ